MTRKTRSIEAIKYEVASLRSRGMKVVDIGKHLNVSERQVYRALAEARRANLFNEFEPWTLLAAIADEDPGEKIRYLIEGRGLWTRGYARYMWAIAQAKPDIPVEVAGELAALYWHVDKQLQDPVEKTDRAWCLDLALAIEPWADARRREEFTRAVQGLGRYLAAVVSEAAKDLGGMPQRLVPAQDLGGLDGGSFADVILKRIDAADSYRKLVFPERDTP
ncbi:MAG: helix-turn-helix domain-containing protein [Chloroflexi bacterium]|nr:helix-turn-helix domain-containing protein [Chloroflexota bacterium]